MRMWRERWLNQVCSSHAGQISASESDAAVSTWRGTNLHWGVWATSSCLLLSSTNSASSWRCSDSTRASHATDGLSLLFLLLLLFFFLFLSLGSSTNSSTGLSLLVTETIIVATVSTSELEGGCATWLMVNNNWGGALSVLSEFHIVVQNFNN